MCVPSPFLSKVTRYVAAVVSTASICPVNNPSWAPRRRAMEQYTKRLWYLCYNSSQSHHNLMCVCLHYQWLLFLYWVSKGFLLEGLCSLTHQKSFPAVAAASFASSAAELSVPQQKMQRSTWMVSKNKTLSLVFEQKCDLLTVLKHCLIKRHTFEASPSASWLFPIQLWSTFLFSSWETTPWGTGRIHCLLQIVAWKIKYNNSI